MASEDEETVYCICRKPYDETEFMIECDVCQDWFHGSCVGIKEHQATDIEIYHCPNCQVTKGPLVLKKRRNYHRHDYSESDDNLSKAVQTGTFQFVQELKHRTFPSMDGSILRLHGSEITMQYLMENGFNNPIMVDKKDGLHLKVPPPTFTVQDVENNVGSMRELDVIDVAKQEDYKMVMREWTEYYNSPNRSKIFNVISLEFSNTKLAELVEPPRIVRELSWVSNYWPDESDYPEQCEYTKPQVQRYCLMGVKDSFTDFHIDFGGTSVWYHVLRGEKVFYLIQPSTANLTLYERWLSSSSQSETFFGDQVDVCYKCTVKAGQTMFIPTGWIHAVLTPIDSLVFGGNFLHDFNISLQIQMYEIEKRVKTPEKYMFPNFETVHWYAAANMLEIIKAHNEAGTQPPTHLLNGMKSLATSLKQWTHKRDYIKRDFIPEAIQYGKLLKDLNKEVKTMTEIAGKLRAHDKSNRKRQKKSAKKEQTDENGEKLKLGEVVAEPPLYNSDTPLVSSASFISSSSMSHVMSHDGSTQAKTEAPQSLSASQAAALKMRIPKAGAFMDMSVYDFTDDFDDHVDSKPSTPLKSMGLKSPPGSTSPKGLGKLSLKAMSNPRDSPSLKLKVSNGKIVNEGMPEVKFEDPVEAAAANLVTSATEEIDCKLQQPFLFKSPIPSSAKPEPNTDSDSEDQLVVDENPLRKVKESTLKPGSLKLKLSIEPTRSVEVSEPTQSVEACVNSPMLPLDFSLPTLNLTLPGLDQHHKLSKGDTTANALGLPSGEVDLSPPGDLATGHALGEEDGEDISNRANMPTIRGGLNGSIADILEASGYGTETDFKIDEDISRRASPSMRDAIQGMLSMSQMGSLQMTPLASDPFKPKASIRLSREIRGNKRKIAYDEECGDKMPSCYNDEEYVYPTLDLSDTEEEFVFKPRGRLHKDETWNPKAKLQPNCPKPERPQRQGTRKESVESGLAAAAARLASQPPPKRQYIRKKKKVPTATLR